MILMCLQIESVCLNLSTFGSIIFAIGDLVSKETVCYVGGKVKH